MLALRGESMISRQSASFLAALGMDSWIAASADDYVERAIAHASDLATPAKTRATLREKMRGSPICDARGFTSDLEALLTSVY